MQFDVINDKMTWNEYYSVIKNENKDIYFKHDYCHLYEANKEGRIFAAVFRGDNGGTVLYPFLLKPVKGYSSVQYYDIETCYGYGGPIVENPNEDDLINFEETFHEWCCKNNVIAEFIRFHPLLRNHNYFNKNILKEKNRTTVYINLRDGLEHVWHFSISSKNRNMIRKAEKGGVQIRLSDDYDSFRDIYRSTMDKVNAGDYYYFSEAYFNQLKEMDKDSIFLLEAVLNNEIIASALFLQSDKYINYYLAGSKKEYLSYAPNNLILYNAIKIGCIREKETLHLGGGTSDSEDDNLFKFKKSFSNDLEDFYIGKRIHNLEQYNLFMNEWRLKNKKEPKLFLQYEY